MEVFEQMRARMKDGAGFIAALDQSGGSTPKALAQYGVASGDYDGDAAMFAEIQKMRERIIRAKDFSSDKVIGAILFERTIHEDIDGKRVASYLWESLGIVPFLKIDKGLTDRADDVQVMKPIDGLEHTLSEARALGIFGTKERSVIHAANKDGIDRIVANQFEVAAQVLHAGMVPILEPEIDIGAADKAAAEEMLKSALMAHVADLPEGVEIMLKLTIPDTPGLYDDLADHPRVLRVVALSGGYSTEEACRRLAENSKMIASFSRALTEGLQKSMSDAEFDAALGKNIDQIHRASIT